MIDHWAWFGLGMVSGLPLCWGAVRLATGHQHRWQASAAQPRGASPLLANASTTAVLWRCGKRGCTAFTSEVIDGEWSERDLGLYRRLGRQTGPLPMPSLDTPPDGFEEIVRRGF